MRVFGEAGLKRLLVPWRDEGSADEVLHAELVCGISVVFAIIGTVFGLGLAIRSHGFSGLSEFCAVGAVVLGSNVLLVRRRRWLGAARWSTSLQLVWLMFIAAFVTQGYRFYESGWVVCLPLLAMFLLGVRNGALLGLVLAAQAGVHWWLEASGRFVPSQAHLEYPAALMLASTAGMLLVVIGLGAVYEHAHASRRSRLARTIEELKEAHRKLATAQEQLLASEKLSSLGMLAAGVAHEINNPMAFITSNVNALARDLEELATDPQLRNEYATDVLPATLDGIRRVNAIVSDLRRFARGDPESFVEYDLNAEIAAAMRISQSQLSARQTRLQIELGPIPPVRGLPRQIMQVVMNLVVNAVQASEIGGPVRVASWTVGDEVAIKVQDSGTGMSPETLGRLFQPFFTTKPVGVGTGLGLAVVHGIVTGHGGRIDVESSPGTGSAFTVWLPLHPRPERLRLLAGAGPRAGATGLALRS